MTTPDFDRIRSVSEYRNMLKGCETASLKKLQSFLDLIGEEIDLTPSEFSHDPIFIAVSKIVDRGLTLSDAWSIQYMFSEDWSVLPWPQPLHKKEIVDGLTIRIEDDTDESTYKNRSIFKMALADVITFRTSEVLPFEITSQVIRITNDLIENAENFYPAIGTDEGLIFWVDNYKAQNEDPVPKSIINLVNFYKYLDFIGAILCVDDNLLNNKDHPLHIVEWPHVDESSPAKRSFYTKEQKVKICDLDILKKFAVRLGVNEPATSQKVEERNFPRGEKNEADKLNAQRESEDEEDDCFSYDGGISAPYAYTDLELFIMKKILLEHRQRDDAGFCAKELSLNNDSLAEICRPINLMIEDKILHLSANTNPRPEDNGGEGIEDRRGFINWKLVQKLDKNPSEIDSVGGGVNFDTDGVDDLRLKARIDFGIEEFMNDRIQNPFGSAFGMDKTKVSEMLARNEQEPDKKKKKWVKENFGSEESTYLYGKQREIVIHELAKNNGDDMVMPLNDFRDKQVDVLKTLLALEKENFLRIKELGSNPMYDDDGNFLGKWSAKDNPVARISILKMPTSIATKPMTKVFGNMSITTEKKSSVGETPFVTKPEFDEKKSRIVWDGHLCEIPMNENSYFFCKKIFVPDFGEKISELDISDQDEWDGGSPRSVYNAMNWVNGLIKDKYGIEVDLFKSRKNYFWIRDELFQSP